MWENFLDKFQRNSTFFVILPLQHFYVPSGDIRSISVKVCRLSQGVQAGGGAEQNHLSCHQTNTVHPIWIKLGMNIHPGTYYWTVVIPPIPAEYMTYVMQFQTGKYPRWVPVFHGTSKIQISSLFYIRLNLKIEIVEN